MARTGRETGVGPPADPAAAARIVAEFAFDGVVLRLYAVRDWVGEPRALGDEHQRLQWFARRRRPPCPICRIRAWASCCGAWPEPRPAGADRPPLSRW
ncbi:hypothetical protein FE772_13470 [Lysobacter enzymogenes]|nr:hypothetical protein [Lysobacter enzymogenes]QCW26520.1 hypothetical protein FE772_13470 [Lysobacter enzymogenes]